MGGVTKRTKTRITKEHHNKRGAYLKHQQPTSGLAQAGV